MARKNDILSIYTKEVEDIKEAGLFKGEAPFVSPQGARVKMEDGRELLCMCANNYLGLGDSPRLIEAAMKRDTELHLSDLSVEHRTFINSSRRRSPASSEPMTRFFTLPALMQTVAFLRRS